MATMSRRSPFSGNAAEQRAGEEAMDGAEIVYFSLGKRRKIKGKQETPARDANQTGLRSGDGFSRGEYRGPSTNWVLADRCRRRRRRLRLRRRGGISRAADQSSFSMARNVRVRPLSLYLRLPSGGFSSPARSRRAADSRGIREDFPRLSRGTVKPA